MIAVLLLALAQDPDLARVQEFQQKVRACVEKVRPAYVFFGQGSGVCVSPDGWVLTNYHVAGNRPGQRVRFPGGRAFTADVVGWDVHGDISLCRIRDAKDLPFCELGDSDALRVGQTVIAVGNPFMLGSRNWEPTVTMGIVSALHRYMDNPGYFDAIQTDAQINPGNSGGPLVNSDGKVIGVNTFIFTESGGSLGIGFAIPINVAVRVVREILQFGEVQRVWTGIGLRPITPYLAAYLNITDRKGLIVAELVDGSPADRAGVHVGDIIRTMNGEEVWTIEQANRLIFGASIGETVRLGIERDGARREIRLRLEAQPSQTRKTQ